MRTPDFLRKRRQREKEAAERAAATPESDYLRAVIAWATAQREAGTADAATGRVAIMAAEQLAAIEATASPQGSTALALSSLLGIPLKGTDASLTRQTAAAALQAAAVELAEGRATPANIRGGLHAARTLGRHAPAPDVRAVSARMAMILSGASVGGPPGDTLVTPKPALGWDPEDVFEVDQTSDLEDDGEAADLDDESETNR